jgi:hypothetical protein
MTNKIRVYTAFFVIHVLHTTFKIKTWNKVEIGIYKDYIWHWLVLMRTPNAFLCRKERNLGEHEVLFHIVIVMQNFYYFIRICVGWETIEIRFGCFVPFHQEAHFSSHEAFILWISWVVSSRQKLVVMLQQAYTLYWLASYTTVLVGRKRCEQEVVLFDSI